MTTPTMLAPQPGDIGLVKIQGRVGALIRFGQWLDGDGFEDFEHAFVYLGDGELVEAEPGGARIVPLTEYAGWNIYWSTGKIPLTDEQRQAICTGGREMEGVPYSFLDYFALALHRFKLPIPFLKNYIKSTKHVICSQLCDLVYSNAHVQLFNDGRWEGFVTPGALYKRLAAE